MATNTPNKPLSTPVAERLALSLTNAVLAEAFPEDLDGLLRARTTLDAYDRSGIVVQVTDIARDHLRRTFGAAVDVTSAVSAAIDDLADHR